MKKLQILIIVLIISLSFFAFAKPQVRAETPNLSQFVFNTVSSPQTAGSAFSITITAKTSNGNTVTSYTGTNTLSVSSGTISPASTTAFVAGIWSGQVTLSQAGKSISMSTSGGGKSGTCNSFTINPAVLDHFVFNTVSSPQTAGQAFSITITAKDSNGNTVTSYTGTNTLTVSSGTISPASTSAFVAGVWTSSVSLSVSGSGITIGTSGSSKSGASNSFTINAGTLDHFVFSNIGIQTMGIAFIITVTAKDSNGNTVTSYTGTNTLSASLGTISPTRSGTFSLGVWMGYVTLSISGSGITIGTSGSSKSGTSNLFTINPVALDHFVFNTVSSPQTAGQAFSITITAKDSNGNTVTSYTGTPTLSVSTGPISSTIPGAFSSGVWTGAITITTSGLGVTVTATDGTHTGTSNSFKVNSSVATYLMVSSGASEVAGMAFPTTITAKDAYGNTANGYAGTIKITSNDSQAVLPSNYAFQASDAGVHDFIVTLITVGSQSITASDSVTGSIIGSQTGVTVTHSATASSIVISPAFSSVTAGLSKTYTSTAYDAYGNSWDATYSTTWSISSAAGGSWSSNIYTSATAGSWIVTGTYASVANSTVLMVNPAGLDHFVFNTVGTQTTGSAFSIAVTAKDTSNNTVAGYSGTPSLACSGLITPTNMNEFVSGVGLTSVTITTSGLGVTVTATDGTHTGTSNSFTVNPIISASAGVGGYISPSGVVSVNYDDSPTFNITASTGYYIIDVLVNGGSVGAVNSYTFTNVQASYSLLATFAPIPTPSPSPTATTTPALTPTPKPTATPKPIPKFVTVPVNTINGLQINLVIQGDMYGSIVSNGTLTTDTSNTITTLSIPIVDQTVTSGFGNVSIPISAVPYGAIPIVYVNNGVAQNQGYCHDSNNYYVWFKTGYSTYELSITFVTQAVPADFPLWIFLILIPVIVIVASLVLARKKIGKLLTEKEDDYSDYV